VSKIRPVEAGASPGDCLAGMAVEMQSSQIEASGAVAAKGGVESDP
jgi:hypothetical protein